MACRMGFTESDEWRENPDPPTSYGRAHPQVVLEITGQTTWVWHTKNSDAYYTYKGPTMAIEE